MTNLMLFTALFVLAALSFGLALVLQLRAPGVVEAPETEPPREPTPLAAMASMGSSELARQLAQAGFTHPDAERWLTWAKLGAGALGVVVGFILTRSVPALAAMDANMRIMATVVPGLLFYFVPVRFIDRRRKAWIGRIQLGLPDALDFMLICVEAGQSSDMAVMRVADELRPVHPELSDRFVALTEALAAGADRHEAWMRLATETENDDLRQLATIINQSSTMGTPIAQTLRVFAADLRDRRVRKVEEKANVLPTKMTLGTMLFTVPPLLILLLAPSIYRISTSF